MNRSQDGATQMPRRESSRGRAESSSSRRRNANSGDAPDGADPSKDQSKINWKKFVTLNPPNLVKFSMVDTDVQRIKPLPGQPKPNVPDDEIIDADEAKCEAFVEIVNKSEHYILFKVKTTNIQGYVVRPNADIIPRDHSMKVRVITQYSLSQCRTLVSDKFLVQMALVDLVSIPNWAKQKITNDQLSLDEIQLIWD